MDVIRYWNRIAASCGDPRRWEELSVIEQQHICESLNMLFFVLNNVSRVNQQAQA